MVVLFYCVIIIVFHRTFAHLLAKGRERAKVCLSAVIASLLKVAIPVYKFVCARASLIYSYILIPNLGVCSHNENVLLLLEEQHWSCSLSSRLSKSFLHFFLFSFWTLFRNRHIVD